MHEDTGADAEVKEFTSLDSGSSSEAAMGDSHSAWATTHAWGSGPKLWVCPSP